MFVAYSITLTLSYVYAKMTLTLPAYILTAVVAHALNLHCLHVPMVFLLCFGLPLLLPKKDHQLHGRLPRKPCSVMVPSTSVYSHCLVYPDPSYFRLLGSLCKFCMVSSTYFPEEEDFRNVVGDDVRDGKCKKGLGWVSHMCLRKNRNEENRYPEDISEQKSDYHPLQGGERSQISPRNRNTKGFIPTAPQ